MKCPIGLHQGSSPKSLEAMGMTAALHRGGLTSLHLLSYAIVALLLAVVRSTCSRAWTHLRLTSSKTWKQALLMGGAATKKTVSGGFKN